MASGFRKKRGDDEYVFIDGKAMRAEEAVRIDLRDTMVPGQEEIGSVPGAAEAAGKQPRKPGRMADALKSMGKDDAFELSPEVLEGDLGVEHTRSLLADERRKLRTKYAIFGGVLILLTLASLCLSSQHPGQIKSPVDVASSIARWIQLAGIYIFQNGNYHTEYLATTYDNPYFSDTVLQVQIVFKYLACGALLAVSGMLYQNAFKNPIAAPSMLGVTNGINAALLVLVLQFGYEAYQYTNL